MTVAMQGDFGKPRPALVIQSERFSELQTITILPITSTIIESPLIRVIVTPSEQNGLTKKSQIMVDKIMTVRKEKLGHVFGVLPAEAMLEVDRSMAVFLGIAR